MYTTIFVINFCFLIHIIINYIFLHLIIISLFYLFLTFLSHLYLLHAATSSWLFILLSYYSVFHYIFDIERAFILFVSLSLIILWLEALYKWDSHSGRLLLGQPLFSFIFMALYFHAAAVRKITTQGTIHRPHFMLTITHTESYIINMLLLYWRPYNGVGFSSSISKLAAKMEYERKIIHYCYQKQFHIHWKDMIEMH